MSEDMQKIIACMQEAVDAEMERKAKLGYKAVIADKNDRPKHENGRMGLYRL